METLYILSEGRSEVNFIKTPLSNYLAQTKKELCLIPITIPTGKGKGGWRRAGGYSYAVARINEIMKMNGPGLYTTFFDLYGLPSDIPCRLNLESMSDPLQKAELCEEQFLRDFKAFGLSGNYQFFPHIQPHELEAFLFVEPVTTAKFLDINSAVQTQIEQTILSIKNNFISPEHINDSPETAPSKRLIKIKPTFRKTLSWKALDNVDKIRDQCAHFNIWLKTIEAL